MPGQMQPLIKSPANHTPGEGWFLPGLKTYIGAFLLGLISTLCLKLHVSGDLLAWVQANAPELTGIVAAWILSAGRAAFEKHLDLLRVLKSKQ